MVIHCAHFSIHQSCREPSFPEIGCIISGVLKCLVPPHPIVGEVVTSPQVFTRPQMQRWFCAMFLGVVQIPLHFAFLCHAVFEELSGKLCSNRIGSAVACIVQVVSHGDGQCRRPEVDERKHAADMFLPSAGQAGSVVPQKVSHFPKSSLLGSKSHLSRALQRMQRQFGKNQRPPPQHFGQLAGRKPCENLCKKRST